MPADLTNPSDAGPTTKPRVLSLEREGSLRARLIARDEAALVELIDVASPWLLGLAQSMLSDREESEEVVSDGFRIAWQKVGTLPVDEDQRLLPWLFRIVRNRALDRLRGRRRQRTKLDRIRAAESPEAATVAAVEPDESASPGWHVHRVVHDSLGALPVDQRTVVRLAYFEGFTHSEIAEHLGIPLGTVKTRLRLAFDKLRAALAPLEGWVE